MPLKPAVPSCDICGIDKGETNHWFVVWLDLTQFNSESYEPGIIHADQVYACGSDHALIFYHRWLTTKSLNKGMMNSLLEKIVVDQVMSRNSLV